MSPEELIYLDHNATTPTDHRVLEAMLPHFRESFGNASSRHHEIGRTAAHAVDGARDQVAKLISADPREVIFTSGATEANNLALKGLGAAAAYHDKRHAVTVRTEHHAVLDPCRWLETQGLEVTYLPVDGQGRIDLNQIAQALRSDTLFVSVMYANNEIGILHPVTEIGRLCRDRGVFFHTDATQALGREPIDVNAACIDLLSASAHKAYGPKGVGALYVRRRGPRVRLDPMLHGGGHQQGIRSGTLDVPSIVGFGMAAEICQQEGADEQERIRALRDHLETGLIASVSDIRVNGGDTDRLANTLNLSIPGIDAESLLRRLPTLCLSTAAACTSDAIQPSHVLGALGLPDDLIAGSIRFSLGRSTTRGEIDRVLVLVTEAVMREREDGPTVCEA